MDIKRTGRKRPIRESLILTKPDYLPRLRRDDTLLLLIDVQERLVPTIHNHEQVVANCATLAAAASHLQLPIIATEQYPEKLGATVSAITEAAPLSPISKMKFSACTDQTLQAITATNRKTALVCGIEAHVCVLQSTLDLIENGFTVFVALDAVSSRREENKQSAWERMRAAGVLAASTESAIFELLREAGTPDFKAMLRLIK
jgi:nicotinamidase-related amidase